MSKIDLDNLVPVSGPREIIQREVAAQKKIQDLPFQDSKMNTLSVIASYELFGLDDKEIGQMLGLSSGQVGNIRMSDGYLKLMEQISKNIYERDKNDLRSGFVQHSKKALDTIVGLLDDADEDKVRLEASKDLLDRAGFRPADIVEHKHSFDNELKIVYVKKEVEPEIPVIEGVVTQIE